MWIVTFPDLERSHNELGLNIYHHLNNNLNKEKTLNIFFFFKATQTIYVENFTLKKKKNMVIKRWGAKE